jgi:hypothetical protein
VARASRARPADVGPASLVACIGGRSPRRASAWETPGPCSTMSPNTSGESADDEAGSRRSLQRRGDGCGCAALLDALQLGAATTSTTRHPLRRGRRWGARRRCAARYVLRGACILGRSVPGRQLVAPATVATSPGLRARSLLLSNCAAQWGRRVGADRGRLSEWSPLCAARRCAPARPQASRAR